ncbi:hypothetical protein KXD40_000318 [Peronospora effusa]|uniref:Uncharacterized protein n=1 Tax=Peronospora effusa TaxID=542832 RepID=A0A3M6VEQ9_9STRA|nr:hypothetical protein DD238_004352 [Peronospora effusa]RQM15713.1 hypothetical protein DD237_003651 [Peronospora effusa]UIZ21707.1 hypothetical protein KXD40_000318 [Peronospora effusa]
MEKLITRGVEDKEVHAAATTGPYVPDGRRKRDVKNHMTEAEGGDVRADNIVAVPRERITKVHTTPVNSIGSDD